MKLINWILTKLRGSSPPQPSSTLQMVFTNVVHAGGKVQIQDNQSVSATIELKSAGGNVVPLDPTLPAPVWSVGNSTAISVTAQPDGSAVFKALGPLSPSEPVSVTYNGLTANDAITVVAGVATTATIVFGTPQ